MQPTSDPAPVCRGKEEMMARIEPRRVGNKTIRHQRQELPFGRYLVEEEGAQRSGFSVDASYIKLENAPVLKHLLWGMPPDYASPEESASIKALLHETGVTTEHDAYMEKYQK